MEGKYEKNLLSDQLQINFTRMSTSVDCKLDIENNGGKIKSISISATDASGFQWYHNSINLSKSWLTYASLITFIVAAIITVLFVIQQQRKSTDVKKLRIERDGLEKEIDEFEKEIIKLSKQLKTNPNNKWIVKRLQRYENKIIFIEQKLIELDKKIEDILYNTQKYTPLILDTSTEKQSYIPGDIIKVSGKVKQAIPNTLITIIVSDPSGIDVSKSSVSINENNTFEVSLEPDGLWLETGKYKIHIAYKYNNKIDEKTIEFTFTSNDTWRYATLHEDLVAPKPIKIKKQIKFKLPKHTLTEKAFDDLVEKNIVEESVVEEDIVDKTISESMPKNPPAPVSIDTTNCEVKDIQFDKDVKSIIINFVKPRPDEILIRIPRIILDSKVGQEDVEFIVLADGEEIDFEETKTSSSSHRSITIKLLQGVKQIEVIGTVMQL